MNAQQQKPIQQSQSNNNNKTTTNFIENWKITNYITFPPAELETTNNQGHRKEFC